MKSEELEKFMGWAQENINDAKEYTGI